MSVWARRPLVVGHRGGRGVGWPLENTIAAFEQARRQGAPAVELDVRTCAGGDLIVFHDATLSRMTKGRDDRRVSDVSLSEVRALGAPTLDEVLGWARSSGVAVNVEMKHDVVDRTALARTTARAIRAAGADVLLSSFDPWLLLVAGIAAPSTPRALLVQAAQPLWADLLQRMVRPPFALFLHLERTRVDRQALARYLRRGLRIGAWTVNDPREARDLIHVGVASIITDVPGVILEALALTRN